MSGVLGRLLGRLVDRGAITAAFVGIGMAVTIGVSFLLVIPIEPIYWALSVPAGLLIGYYADARSGRERGAWGRILANSLFAGLVTGLTLAALLIGVKALFFAADDGYRDPGLGGRLSCRTGGDCVYQRYLEDQPAALEAAGVTDAATFGTFFWAQQWSTAGLLVLLSTGFGLAGGAIYGATRPRPVAEATASAARVAVGASDLAQAPQGIAATIGSAAGTDRGNAQAVLDTLLATARSLLEQQGAFLPIGASLDPDGRVALVGADPGDEPTTPDAVVTLLIGGFRSQANTGRIQAAGIASDAFYTPEGGVRSDAIAIEIEQLVGPAMRLAQPYRRAENGRLEYGEIARIVPGPARIFAG